MRCANVVLLAILGVAIPSTAIADVPPAVLDAWPAMSRREVLRRVNDSVNPRTAIQRYLGDFNAYWTATQSSRAGKFAEAHAALGYRRFAQLHGLPYDVTPTSLWNTAHSFDLVVRDLRTGAEYHYQMKLGFQASIDALSDTKYATGLILTARDTLDSIRGELARETARAARRGLPLAGNWAIVQAALTSGRLTDQLPGGYRIAERAYITSLAERYFRQTFVGVVEAAGGPRATFADRTVRTLGTTAGLRIRLLGRAGRSLGVLGAGVSLYRGTDDIERYRLGKLDVSELSARLTFRGVMVAGGLYSVVAVPAGPAGWVVGGSVIAGEVALEHYENVQDEQFQRTLAALERNDRYAETRAAVLRDLAAAAK